MSVRTAISTILMLAVLVLAACTSSANPTTTTAAPTTTTEAPTTTATTTVPPPTATTTTPPLEAPRIGDSTDVAFEAFFFMPEFTHVVEPTEADIDLAASIEAWVPSVLVDGLAAGVFLDEDDNSIVVYSIVPLTGLRANPWTPYVFALWGNEDTVIPDEATGIVELDATSGGTFYLWDEGDGLMIAVSEDNNAARRYLEARMDIDEPNPVWATGACLYLPQDQPDFYGRTPYAPFALDLVVTCRGPHNAEVLLAEYTGTDLDEYDRAELTYERAYRCDEAYYAEFGASQDGYRPAMITYMPDADEFERGDRYIACVVVRYEVSGLLLFEGRMADLPDLEWVLGVGDCLAIANTFETNCDASHRNQFLGTTMVDLDDYPAFGSTDFDDACAEFDAGFVDGTDTDAEVNVFSHRIQPYQFELGNRTVNCYAAAVVEDVGVEVTGSFFDKWSVVDEDADSA